MPILARLTTAALLITLTACANQPAAPPAPPSAATATAAPAATPTAATPTAPPPPTTSPTPAASPQSAADGSDLAACKDADCEVEIRAGDRLTIDERFGVQRLTISSLNADEAVLTLLGSTGGLRAEGMSVSVSGTCVNGRCRDEGKLTLTPHSPGRINSIRLELPYLTDDHAILRLTRK